MVKKITQIIIVLVLLFAIPLAANALTLAWNSYSDTGATDLRIYHSLDQSEWTLLVDSIPTDMVASEIPDGSVNTRVYYMMRAVDTNPNPDAESGNSNVVSYFWLEGGGHTGPSAVGGITLINCGPLDNIPDDGSPEWDICNSRHKKP